MHEERIMLIHKGNKYIVCPACDALEAWECAVLCGKTKDKLKAWVTQMHQIFNDVAKIAKLTTYEKI